MRRQRFTSAAPPRLGSSSTFADNTGKHVGKLRIGHVTIEWCRGRTRVGNGRKLPMHEFIEQHLEQLQGSRNDVGFSGPTTKGPNMALNFSKLHEALEFTRKDQAKPNLSST